jgi:hypothetical protein
VGVVSATYRCDCCGTVTDKPCIEIARTDGWSGGGVDVNLGHPHHFCLDCAQAVYAALRVRRSELKAART